MSKIDIIKLAKALNLSKSTVSRAFRDNSDINPTTKERVLKMAKELNYRPNHYASNLREQKSKTIAVVVPELANNYFTQIIQGVERVAKTKGYHILIFVTDDDLQKEKEFIRSISNGRVDGVLMSVSGESEDHSYLNRVDFDWLPVVLFDRVYDDIELPTVVTDDYDSSYLATQHLMASGCKRIAYLVVNKEQSIGKTRMQGYLDALRDGGLPTDESLIADCSNCYDENAVILKTFLGDQKPDGILASVERLAVSAYYVCREQEVRIPEDIKIVAFSSLEIAELLNPSLSTVTQPAIQIGEHAANILLDKLLGVETKGTLPQVVLSSELVVRDSSRV